MYSLVTDYLDHTVTKFPDKIAFSDPRREISFAGLYAESRNIANVVISKGIFKKPVLLYMDKSTALVSAMIGTAYSGNFYTPVDTKMPEERILKICDTLSPAAIITDNEHAEQINRLMHDRDILIFEDIIIPYSGTDRIAEVHKNISSTDTLYVLFTSGSTGTPKGVTISHRAVVDFTDWISGCYEFDETTVFANQAQLYFDLSIQDVYAPLRNGSTTVLIPNRLFVSPVRVWKEILRHGVNTLVWIPSELCLFANLDVLAHVERADLKTVLFCGEVMPVKQLNYWIKHYPEVTYANLYGPTECTEACTYYTIDRSFADGDVLPIGKPCDNTKVLIIGEDGQLVTAPGVTGELCIGGICLSDGYYNDPVKTSEAFVQNPFNTQTSELIYKTGDLACYNDMHELIYIGRKDRQIKIRGYRVELGEIEAASSTVEQVTYNCCLFNSDEEKIILVYTGDISGDDLKKSLECKLQDYMIPSVFIHRDEMIFNKNGKIDRLALAKEYLQ